MPQLGGGYGDRRVARRSGERRATRLARRGYTCSPLRRVRWHDRRRDLTRSGRARSRGRRRTRRDRPRCTPGTAGPARTTESVRMPHHRVVPVAVVMPVTRMLAEGVAAEEDDRDDEDDPGDDRDPGRELEDPRGPVYHLDGSVGRRRSCGSSPHGGGFRCFTHETHDAGVTNSRRYALVKYQL